METFSALLTLVRGNHRSPPWINGWVNNRDLRRHSAHCDVIVMRIACLFHGYTVSLWLLSHTISCHTVRDAHFWQIRRIVKFWQEDYPGKHDIYLADIGPMLPVYRPGYGSLWHFLLLPSKWNTFLSANANAVFQALVALCGMCYNAFQGVLVGRKCKDEKIHLQ